MAGASKIRKTSLTPTKIELKTARNLEKNTENIGLIGTDINVVVARIHVEPCSFDVEGAATRYGGGVVALAVGGTVGDVGYDHI